nr:hypothetical protein KXZ65_01200 [Pectobacterium sp. PL152]
MINGYNATVVTFLGYWKGNASCRNGLSGPDGFRPEKRVRELMLRSTLRA